MIGFSPSHDFRGHILRGARAIARQSVGCFIRNGQAEVNQLKGLEIFGTDIISRADVAMDETCVVDGLQRGCHLAYQFQPVRHEILISLFDQYIDARAVNVLHQDVFNVVCGKAKLVGPRDQRMLNRTTDFSLGRFVESFESVAEKLGLFLVQQFDSVNVPCVVFRG